MKIDNFINENKSIVQFFINALILIFVIINAIGLSSLLDYLLNADVIQESTQIWKYIYITLFIIPITFLFVPSYKQKKYLFMAYDPIDKFTTSVIEISYNFMSRIYLFLTFFLALFYILSNEFTSGKLLFTLILIINSSIYCLTFQTWLESKNVIINIISFFVTTILIVINFYYPSNIFNFFVTMFLIANYYCLQMIYKRSSVSNRSIEKHSSKNVFGILSSIYLKTRIIKINLMLALFLKAVFLFIIFDMQKGRNLLIFNFYEYFLVSSIILFTYIHNNIWGYLKTTYKLISPKQDIKLLFNSYLFLLCVPVFFDLGIATSLLLFFNKSIFNFLLFYLVSLFSNTMVGFYSSLSSPIEINKAIDLLKLKSNTPIKFNILSVLLTGVYFLLFINTAAIIGVFVSISLLFFIYYQMIIKGRITEHIKDTFGLFK